MRSYKVLSLNIFSEGEFEIIPIRQEDREVIRKWRNEQMYHLRQSELLTKEKQDCYFENVVSKLFEEEKPGQLLFSFLKNSECIGYGGLVHINWIDSHAEISFLMDTKLEALNFNSNWTVFLKLIEQVAFSQLGLHKIFTYAYAIRTNLFPVLLEAGYRHEAVLKEHTFFDQSFIDVFIHAKMNDQVNLRLATSDDVELTYTWLNNAEIRRFSFNRNFVPFEQHSDWFLNRLKSDSTRYYIAVLDSKPIGSFRADKQDNEAVISFLLSPDNHGKGLGFKLLSEGVKRVRLAWSSAAIVGLVQVENQASAKLFRKLKFSESTLPDGVTLKFTLKP